MLQIVRFVSVSAGRVALTAQQKDLVGPLLD
jgi:hypothetical protein